MLREIFLVPRGAFDKKKLKKKYLENTTNFYQKLEKEPSDLVYYFPCSVGKKFFHVK